MTDKPEIALIALVDQLEAALKATDTESPDAVYQCERLRQALSQSHSEGARFAAFTLGRLIRRADPAFDEATREAHDALRTALSAAGHKV